MSAAAEIGLAVLLLDTLLMGSECCKGGRIPCAICTASVTFWYNDFSSSAESQLAGLAVGAAAARGGHVWDVGGGMQMREAERHIYQ